RRRSRGTSRTAGGGRRSKTVTSRRITKGITARSSRNRGGRKPGHLRPHPTPTYNFPQILQEAEGSCGNPGCSCGGYNVGIWPSWCRVSLASVGGGWLVSEVIYRKRSGRRARKT